MRDSFALQHDLEISRGPQNRGYLQFADGTSQETVGRVHTYWTFKTGEKIPVTFEVLENCCHDLILGEDVLWNHDVFRVHAASIHSISNLSELDRLAPFGYVGRLEKFFGGSKTKGGLSAPRFTGILLNQTGKTMAAQPTSMEVRGAEEERRRHWNYQYGFDGVKASTEERITEAARRKRYKAKLPQLQHSSVPSIPTAGTTVPHTGVHQSLSQSSQADDSQPMSTLRVKGNQIGGSDEHANLDDVLLNL